MRGKSLIGSVSRPKAVKNARYQMKTKQAKEILQQQLEEARAAIRRLEEKLKGEVDYGLGEGDPNIYHHEMNLALRQSAEEKVKSIEEALLRLDEGTYGLCELCGEEIDPERLEALPYTRRCKRCAL